MMISEKLLRAKADLDAVYEAGKASGGGESYYDIFWDSFQQNGNRTYYRFFFYSDGWNDVTFAPKYNIIPTGEITQIFANTKITDLVAICEKQGIIIDFSKVTQLEYCFQGSTVTRVGVIDASNSTKFVAVFNLCNNLITIGEIVVTSKCTAFNKAFNNCQELKNVNFSGTISADIDFGTCPKLTRSSLNSIRDHLSTYARGKTITFNQSGLAEYGGFDYWTDEYGNILFDYDGWNNFISERPDWTWKLV